MRQALVTGGAGFIGSHLVDRLIEQGWRVTVIDSFDPFYDPALKRMNIETHLKNPSFRLHEVDIRDGTALKGIPGDYDVIVHLAAKAGVRPSLEDPMGYQETNVQGTQNMLEFARQRSITQFVFASSSSVYGVNPDVPWREDDHVLLPISPYAATKVAGELLGHVYSHLYGIRFIALRLFTVYGPRQRPDLAIRKFLERMRRGDPIPMYGDGSSQRDFTFVSDIVDGFVRAMRHSEDRYIVINLGNSRTVRLSELIAQLQRISGCPARIDSMPTQDGDVPRTWADIGKAEDVLHWKPATELSDGLSAFWQWLKSEARE